MLIKLIVDMLECCNNGSVETRWKQLESRVETCRNAVPIYVAEFQTTESTNPVQRVLMPGSKDRIPNIGTKFLANTKVYERLERTHIRETFNMQ